MSRKMLIVAAVGCLLVATLVVPAATNQLEADDAVPAPGEVWTLPDGHQAMGLAPIQPNGACEGAGAGGCPIPG